MTKIYHVSIEAKGTPTQETILHTVAYEAPTYNDAWVGARTVCRLGTLFKDDPACKIASNAREFFRLDDNEPFHCSPSLYTVRKIFASDTRKQGKARMTTLTADQLFTAIEGKKIKVSGKLREVLESVLGDSEGVRITVANARRLLGDDFESVGVDEEGDEKAQA